MSEAWREIIEFFPVCVPEHVIIQERKDVESLFRLQNICISKMK